MYRRLTPRFVTGYFFNNRYLTTVAAATAAITKEKIKKKDFPLKRRR